MIETTEILYDDEEICVIWLPGKTDFVLVTFGDLVSLFKDHRFFADAPARKGNITTVGIVAKRGNWYPKANILAAKGAILSKIEHYTTRIIYGGSMGGYASLKFSKLLGASHVISLCPQWSIDISECNGTDPGYQYYFSERMRGMGIQKQDVCGRVFLFVDSFDVVDMFHCGMILKACPDANFINVPLVGHQITSALAGTDNLLQLIEAVRLLDIDALRAISRRTRRDHWHRKSRIIGYVLAQSPKKGIPLLIDSSMRDGQIMIAHKSRFHAALNYLQQYESPHNAIAFYERFWHVIESTIEQFITCAYLCRPIEAEIVVITAHSTKLIYSYERNACYHGEKFSNAIDSCVKVEILGSSAALFINVNGTRFYLAVE